MLGHPKGFPCTRIFPKFFICISRREITPLNYFKSNGNESSQFKLHFLPVTTLIDYSSGSWVYTFQFITNKSCYIMKVNGATLFSLILSGRADGVWIKWSHLPNGVLLFLFLKIWKKVLKREIFGNVENRFVTHSKHAISDCPKPNIVLFLSAAESDIFRYNTFFTTAYTHIFVSRYLPAWSQRGFYPSVNHRIFFRVLHV